MGARRRATTTDTDIFLEVGGAIIVGEDGCDDESDEKKSPLFPKEFFFFQFGGGVFPFSQGRGKRGFK